MATMEPSITRTSAAITYLSFLESALGISCILSFFGYRFSYSWTVTVASIFQAKKIVKLVVIIQVNLQPTTYNLPIRQAQGPEFIEGQPTTFLLLAGCWWSIFTEFSKPKLPKRVLPELLLRKKRIFPRL